jgi:2-polyprenyl-3-methyl-5-hydroxy-6-metoxy-1,4-benzoquinol methylase
MQVRFTSDYPEIRKLVARALSEPWVRAKSLAVPAAELAKRGPAIADCISPIGKAWPQPLSGHRLWSPSQRSTICRDPLLRALLTSAPICDLQLERFLTCVRATLLEEAHSAVALKVEQAALEFYCALAQQCFINEYVFACGDDERARALALRESLAHTLAAGADIPPLWLAAAGSYAPLHTLPNSRSLLDQSGPAAIRQLLVEQVAEPLEEMRIAATIPAITMIDDAMSLAVRDQYEANPYPRWIKAPPPPHARVSLEDYVKEQCPGAHVPAAGRDEGCDVLVAGCGTGHEPIQFAQRVGSARILAVDLSRASLSFAIRKTREIGLQNIDYAQADILRLDRLGRTFDVIVSSGVLHHLDDPFAGWSALLPLLRPGGLMSIGLYSELGRQAVVLLRGRIAEGGYGASADEIRRFRQQVTATEQPPSVQELLRSPDFFNTSGCRDLLFHVQEHRMTIPQIKSFLENHRLDFIGFVADIRTLQAFQDRFPGRHAVADLDRWHEFETEHPTIFAGMYKFWVRKAEGADHSAPARAAASGSFGLLISQGSV